MRQPKPALTPADTPRRRALLAALSAQAPSLSFYQALRLLTTAGADIQGVVIQATPRLSFQPADFDRISVRDDGRIELRVNGFGLTGPSGALPMVFTDLVQQRRRLSDHGLGDFVNLFSHRAAVLLYRAWAKHQPAIAFEADAGAASDPPSVMLLSLSGVTPASARLTGLPAPLLAGYAPILARRARSAEAVGAALTHLLGHGVTVRGLQPRWVLIPPAERSRLGSRFSSLGQDCVAGVRSLDLSSSVQVTTAPLDAAQFDRLVRRGLAFDQIRALSATLLPPQLRVTLNPVVRADAVPPAGLAGATMLGRNGWLARPAGARPADDCRLLLQQASGDR